MSSETLSQNEIDFLLNGGAQKTAARPKSQEPDVQIYDFRRPHRISKDRLRALEALYGRLAKSLEGWLLARVRGPLELTLQSVEQLSFGEFLLSLPSPCASYIFDIAESGGQQGVVDFGSEFCYLMIDRMLGGTGAPAVLSRPLSTIERKVVGTAAECLTRLLTEAWQDHVPLGLDVSGFESVPEILQASSREDPVLVATIQVTAMNVSSIMIITLPFLVLEKFFGSTNKRNVSAGAQTDRERFANRQLAAKLLKSTRVPVTARLQEFPLSLHDLGTLRPGAMLSTGIATHAEIDILVGSQRRFRASHGKIGSRLAAHVLHAVSTGSDEPVPTRDAVPTPELPSHND